MKAYLNELGVEVTLDKFVAKGGEGAVYTIEGQPGQLAKVYHHARNEEDDREKKIKALVDIGRIRSPELKEIAAVPIHFLWEKKEDSLQHSVWDDDTDFLVFAGFTMPKVKGLPLFKFTNPSYRDRLNIKYDYRDMLLLASNLARAVSVVHAHDLVIGDLNHSNVFADPETATVRLIDVDSWQVRCDDGRVLTTGVGTPEYTAPELQNVPLHDVVRTPQQTYLESPQHPTH